MCGIATFSADLLAAISGADPELKVTTVAMSDRSDYNYPAQVSYEIAETNATAYGPAADFINRKGCEVLSVQHEYGIFGGDAGEDLLQLVRRAKMPIVTTMHTVLRTPDADQRRVTSELLQLSERVVVMTQRAVSYLEENYDIPAHKVDVIPHGIPKIEPDSGKALREKLGIPGPMILTFGLLSPDKGIQYVIEAMPEILAQCPGATYVVVGATHPNIRASNGESYRRSLMLRARELGVEDNVRFVDRFVTAEELIEYLGAMDIYITPYLNAQQITSGTLAYAVGAGKAVISTPYVYAEELLAEGRGVLVPFRDFAAIAREIIDIERVPARREEMIRCAAKFGKEMLWPAVGKRYLESFHRATSESRERMRVLVQKPTSPAQTLSALPELRFEQLGNLTDCTGILQHATYNVPNRAEGYCVDDNARALLLTAYLESAKQLTSPMASAQARYLGFLMDAYNPENGRFRNFMSYQRNWLEDAGSEDSHARSLWALGAVACRTRDRGLKQISKDLFEQGMGAVRGMTSPRTWAYTAIGAHEYLAAYPTDEDVFALKTEMESRLMRQYGYSQEVAGSMEWPWFEQSLTYANARLSQALILSQRPDVQRIGLQTLSWLMKVQTGPNGVFAPIGSNGFFERDGARSWFDQQPVEVAGAVSACLSALKVTGDHSWLIEAHRAFSWFCGDNMLSQPVYDRTTGGCHDGIHEDRINRNQGAESTLSFLCALAELRNAAAPSLAISQSAATHEIKRVPSSS